MIRTASAALVLALTTASASAAPTGVWSMPGGKVTVQVAACGPALCATIVGLKKPLTKSGSPKRDKNNPDAAKRDRPLIGVALLTDMTPDGSEWAGQLYNPDDGRTYAGRLIADGDDVLKLKGCAVGGLICKTQVLTRVR